LDGKIGDRVTNHTSAWWPKPSRFQRALRAGDAPPTSMWVTVCSPEIVEMIGLHGVDAAIIDLEHTTFGLRDVEDLMRAAQRYDMTPLVRLPSVDPHLARRMLDAAAGGLVFPMVSTPEEAALARASMLYPPEGSRGWAGAHARHVGWCGSRLASSGPGLLSPEFLTAANESLVSIFLIENQQGVDHIDEILEQGRPDAVMFGWGDFLVEVGFDRSRMETAYQRVYDVCRQRGIGMALDVSALDRRPYYPGCFVSVGVDSVVASDAFGQVVDRARADVADAIKRT
jgi:2-keto-3-deoxy-L-rhamnonate aldolase RhmA